MVSLVPSLTEAVAVSGAGVLAGVTDWCTHPAELGGAGAAGAAGAGGGPVRIGGTKNPDVRAIVDLAPDLVIANEEENRAPDLEALRAAGLEVLVTEVRDVPSALRELERVLVGALGLVRRPGWLVDAERVWRGVEPGARLDAFVPVWRRPWMVLGRDTFAGDVLGRLGVRNVYAGHAERYPRVAVEELVRVGAGCDLVVLPDEPYRFTAEDGPDAFPALRPALVSGRHLTWYGPSLTEAPTVLGAQLRGRGA
ncbi:helical backbone metal receptor [Streptomyces sp. NPDC047014]|uniref:helical backbone metal receptor n=1 Tax=Streptomyces sp. NPDC047014 TaxID=3155736 RepID=UPI003400EB77